MQSVPIATKVVGFNPTHDKGFVGKCYILDFHSPKCLEITTVLLTDFSLSLTNLKINSTKRGQKVQNFKIWSCLSFIYFYALFLDKMLIFIRINIKIIFYWCRRMLLSNLIKISSTHLLPPF